MPKGPLSEETKAKIKAGWAKRRAALAANKADEEEDERIAVDEWFAGEEAAEAVHKVLHSSTVQVTYRPFDGDPHSVTWNGVKFRANVPVELSRDDPAHYIEQLLPKQFPGLNGEVTTKHYPSKVFMGEMAKTNPSFEVDGHMERKKINSRIVPPPGAEWTDAHEGEISYSSRLDDVA